MVKLHQNKLRKKWNKQFEKPKFETPIESYEFNGSKTKINFNCLYIEQYFTSKLI